MLRSGLFLGALMLCCPALAAQGNVTNQSQGVTDMVAIIDAEFPAYDANRSGMLEQAEFVKWMLALKEQENKATGKTLSAAEMTAWAEGAFALADADRNGAVSKPELIAYLSGSAA